MRPPLLLIGLFINVCQLAIAQYHDANWVLCYGQAGYQNNVILDFGSGQSPQVQVTNTYVPMLIENASISDEQGNLLFFTNGTRLYDRNLNFIAGGILPPPFDTVGVTLGLSQRQGCMFLPWPGDSNRYVLLHTTKELPLPFSYPGWIPYHLPTHLYMTTLDKTYNGGNGGIVSLSQVLLNDTLANTGGGMAVTKHANGRDWWILIKKHYRNKFYKFLLTPSGIVSMGFQQIGLDYQTRLGELYIFTPNGEILGGTVEPHTIALFRFDRCTGMLSNHQLLNNPATNLYFCEDIDFSPNSKVLYANERVKIFQYDLTGIDTPGVVQQTRTIIADTAYTTQMCDTPGYYAKNFFPVGQIASNGVIYYPSNIYCPELTYIEYPDSLGMTSGFNYIGLNIINSNTTAIPYFPNYRLGPVTGSVCDSLTTVHELLAQDISVYPNPAKDNLFITSSRSLNETVITLFNIHSQILLQQSPGFGNNFELSIPPDIGTGIYMLQIQSKEGVVTKKIVVGR
jgi:hypothetical protein